MANQDYQTIATWLKTADTLIINSGAGMGVDSGLPDYRGETDGQWGEVEAQKGKKVFDIVNPKYFAENPSYAWQFFLARMKIYRDTEPHEGFSLILKWIEHFNLDYFCLTSNIDGHFQKAGFDALKVRELHGAISVFQSAQPERYETVWDNQISLEVLEQQIKEGNYPTCPDSEIPARPNVYMFRDNTYVDTRSKEQDQRFQAFLTKNAGKSILVFEIGSGPHVQSIRMKTRMLRKEYEAKIVRINPKEFKIKAPNIGVADTALKALKHIDQALAQ